MRLNSRAAFATALFVSSFASVAGTDYQDEYEKKIKASQDVGVLGNDLAGDRVNFYTGATSFGATDISLPGNALPLSLSRSYEVGYDNHVASYPGPDTYTREIETTRIHAFGDWDLDVPHISTTMTQSGGWIIDSTTPTKRCSAVGQVTSAGVAADGAPPYVDSIWRFHANAYWSGYTLHTPGGEQSMLLASLPNAERPSTGGPFHWTTNQDWWISCLPTIANSGGGEGYLALSPDGTRYTFNWLSRRNVSSIMDRSEKDPDGYGPLYRHYVFRAEFMMLPTRIEDRFGNWIKYEWSNDEFARLTRMSSGAVGSTVAEQSINLSYQDGRISSATDGARTWRYEYTVGRLSKVTLPDATAWQYDFLSLGFDPPPTPHCNTDVSPYSPEYYWVCFGNGEIGEYFNDALVVHPSGAQIYFTFGNHFQYSPNSDGSYPMGLTSKVISGPGLETATWKFAFLPSKEEIKQACRAGTCPTQIMTDQVNPDNSINRRIFGVTPTLDESVLLGELEGSLSANGGGSPAITTSVRWAAILDDIAPASGAVPVFYKETDYLMAPSGQATAYTVQVGANPVISGMFPQVQAFASERRLPVVTRNLVQQGVTFTSLTNTFDKFARPTQTVRRSTGAISGNFSRTESATYHDNFSRWVIGQAATAVDVATGKVISQTDYDASTAMPVRTYSFGLLQQTLGYNADGTLAFVKDGLNNQTTLGEWSRGIPRLISYPTGVTERATVNGLGSILSTTDQLASTTSYSYDVMGRLSRIAYPAGDAVAWADTTRVFEVAPVPEHGLPAGHWKQTVRTGNGQTTTFYDARWHPILTLTEDTALASSTSFVVKRFDAMGREVFSSYPVASVAGGQALLPGVTTRFDALGRPIQFLQDSELGQLTTNTDYLSGFQTQVTNPRGFKTTTRFQVFDAPSQDAPVRIDAEAGVTTVITRDGFGKPLQVTRSGPGG